jgi:hypothetical protein
MGRYQLYRSMGTLPQDVAPLNHVANVLHNFYTVSRITLLFPTNICITKLGYWTPSKANAGQMLPTICLPYTEFFRQDQPIVANTSPNLPTTPHSFATVPQIWLLYPEFGCFAP